jgi:hypothetical protein
MRSTLIRNGHANLVGVEDPSLRAGHADLIVPVPNTASGIGRLGIVEAGENASTVLEVITLEAGEASSTVIMRCTLIRNWNTDFISIENPSLRARDANLVVPIPHSTSGISGLGVIE